MKVAVTYNTIKTTEIEVDDNYKKMLKDDKAWNELIGIFSETVLKKVQEIEDNPYYNNDDILGVSDVETDEIIYET